jgi:hypothetical protein
MWEEKSDRALLWLMRLGVFGIAIWVALLLGRAMPPWEAAIGLAASFWLAWGTWTERRERRLHNVQRRIPPPSLPDR